MADAPATGGTTRRKIALDITSGAPRLKGLNDTTAAVNRLAVAMRKANAQAVMFSRQTGFDFSSLGKGAQTAATQITAAMGTVNKSVAGIKGNIVSTTNALKQFTSGAATRLEETKSQSGFTGTTVRKRFRKGKDDTVFTEESTEEIVKRDLAKEARAAATDKDRRDLNYGRTEGAIVRERQQAIAEQAKMDAEMAKRKQAAAQSQADKYAEAQNAKFNQELANARNKLKSELSNIPGVQGKASSQSGAIRGNVIEAHQKYIDSLTGISRQMGLGKDNQRRLNQAIADAQVKINQQYTAMGGGALPSKGQGGMMQRIWGGDGRFLQRGLAGWTPSGMTKNMLTAGGWMVAVGGFMSMVRVVTHSVERMSELQLQTARLSQVFRGAGGNARELTDDVLKLASAEGRSGDEAMQAAVAWSRLGLTRKQAAEATRVSLMAANVAEMTAAETTEALAAATAAYGLQVYELNGVLGMLNQTSNTYRVTVKDILQGMSRVSGVAKQAGIDISQLQAIIGVSVQQTGQSGPMMANAIKTVMTRMNRPDVQQFFGERYNMYTTGSAEDLQNIWRLYSKVNDEQQRDIQLKLGGATQASRFQAIMEAYPEAIKAEISALNNLNSAEKENLLITNTLIAAKNRLGSSWDRLVNSPMATGALGGVLNGLTSNIDAVNNLLPGSKGKSENLFYDSSKASLLQYPTSLMSAVSGSINNAMGMYYGSAEKLTKAAGITGIDWGATWRNSYTGIVTDYWKSKLLEQQGFSDTPSTEEDIRAMALRGIQSLSSKRTAATRKKDWMETLGRTWGDFNPETRGRITESLSGVMSRASIDKLKSANPEQAKAIFEQERELAKAREMALLNSERLKTEKEIAAINAKPEGSKTAEDEAALNMLLKKRSGIIDDIVEDTQNWEEHASRITPILVQHNRYLEDISSTIQGMGFSPLTGEAEVLRQKISQVKAMLDTDGLSDQVRQELTGDLRNLNASYGYTQSAPAAVHAAYRRNAGIAEKIAGMEVESQGVGRNEGEKLLEKRNWLMQKVLTAESQSKMNGNDLERSRVFATSLLQTQFGIQQRILEVERERKQVMIDSNKEFQRSLIGSSPSELLRKLATSRMSSGGKMSAGQFFSMSGDMQRDAYGLMGGSRMADLNDEHRTLAGASKTTAQIQGMAAQIESTVDKWSAASNSSVQSLANAGMAAEQFAVAMMRATAMITGLASGTSPRSAPTASAPASFVATSTW